MTDAIRELFELLTKKEKSGSDYTGRVTRVDGKTAYVQFDGSDITDTPVALSIGAKAGDSVRVRVADGRAWLVGNDDAPPNDSSEVGYELALTNALIRQLTTEQINGENGWINLLLGTFNYGNKLIWNGRELTVVGVFTAGAGSKIGPWTIGSDCIWYGNQKYGNANGLYFGTSGLSLTDKFKVSAAGALTAILGMIGGWTIGSDSLYSGSTSGTNAQITLKSGDSGYIRVQNDTAGLTELNNAGFLHQTSSGQINIAGGALTIADRSHHYPSYMLSISSRSISYTETTGGGLKFFIDGTTGAITASSISEGGTTLAKKYAPINLNYVRDSANSNSNITFSYYSAGLNYADYTWLAAWNGYQLRAVNKSQFLASTGGTLTGGLTVSGGSVNVQNGNVRAGGTDAFAYAENTTTKCYAAMRSSSNGQHGLYSNGYWNGSAYTASASWFCSRNTSGKWQIADGTTVNGSFSVKGALKGYNEGYTTLRPVVGTNAGTNAVGVIVSSSASFGIYGRWGAGATAAMSGRTIACPASDIRLKENVKDSTVDALSVINAIKIRQFDWKDKSRGHWDCGMVVDEMEKDIDPKFCIGGGEDEDGNISYKCVDTFYLQGYEVKAIQELSKRIEELERRLAS